jgi:hypothetical protein
MADWLDGMFLFEDRYYNFPDVVATITQLERTALGASDLFWRAVLYEPLKEERGNPERSWPWLEGEWKDSPLNILTQLSATCRVYGGELRKHITSPDPLVPCDRFSGVG